MGGQQQDRRHWRQDQPQLLVGGRWPCGQAHGCVWGRERRRAEGAHVQARALALAQRRGTSSNNKPPPTAAGRRLSRNVAAAARSSHGFALNVGGASLLPAFEAIVPCGIKAAGQGVTSMEAELARAGRHGQHVAAGQRAGPSAAAPPASSSTGGGSSSGAGGSGRSAAGQEQEPPGLSVAEVAGRVGDEFARHFGYDVVERGLPSDVH